MPTGRTLAGRMAQRRTRTNSRPLAAPSLPRPVSTAPGHPACAPSRRPSPGPLTPEKVPAPHFGCVPCANSCTRAEKGAGQFPRDLRNTRLTSSCRTSHPNSQTPSRIPIPAGAFLPPGLGRGAAGGRGKTRRKLPGALFGKSGRDPGGRARARR